MLFTTYPYPPIDQITNDPIIYRRFNIEHMMWSFKQLPSMLIKKISVDFECFKSTIYAVMKQIRVFYKYAINIKYPSRSLKNRVAKRDNFTCQYCGTIKPPISEIDHVIPLELGGHSKLYNLVFSCQPCNRKKRTSVKIPINIKVLLSENPIWGKKIENYC